jgi:4-amino-4-deoxy-L-arabinose transferase-like glycosyltransferase
LISIRHKTGIVPKRSLWPIGLIGFFILANLPRLSGLDAFMMADEFLWIYRSRNFLVFLANGNWLRTFQTGHPGVTTTWLGSLGLWIYHRFATGSSLLEAWYSLNLCTFSTELLPLIRLPVVGVTLLCLLLSIKLVQKLWGKQVALLSLVLLTLDPFYLAHSRTLHHDALVSGWMLVASLSILVYALRTSSFRYLLLAGLSAGLALLSKTTALFLFPYSGVILGIMVFRRRESSGSFIQAIRYTALAGLGWVLIVGLTVYALWPAMWVDPLGVLFKSGEMIQRYALNPHTNNIFFWGQIVQDPGLAYYGVTILFRLTPLALVGVGLASIYLLRGFWRQVMQPANKGFHPDGQVVSIGLLFLTAVSFILFLGLGAKKQGRYVLPTILMLDVIAAWGLYHLGSWLNTWRRARLGRGWAAGLGLSLVILGQAGISLPHHPYYLTYYNPLLGGGHVASQVLTVGWGEGLDVVADYLNRKPKANRLQVTTLMHTALAPYFSGNTLSFRPQAHLAYLFALASDYVILYLPDVQRGLPDPALLAYIRQHGALEQVIRLRGIEYAWIYRMPAIKLTLPPPDSPSTIWGYQLEPAQVLPGDTLTITLYYKGDPPTSELLTMPMVDERGETRFGAQLIPARSPQVSPPAEHNQGLLSPIPISEVTYRFKIADSGPTGLYCPLIPGFPFELNSIGESGSPRCWYYQPPPPGRGCVQIRSQDFGSLRMDLNQLRLPQSGQFNHARLSSSSIITP